MNVKMYIILYVISVMSFPVFRSPGWPVFSPLSPDAFSASVTPAPTLTTPAGERTGNTKTISCSESLSSSSILCVWCVCVCVCVWCVCVWCVCVCVCVCVACWAAALRTRADSWTSRSSAEVSDPNPSLPRSSSYGRNLTTLRELCNTRAASGLSRLSNPSGSEVRVSPSACDLTGSFLYLYDLVWSLAGRLKKRPRRRSPSRIL